MPSYSRNGSGTIPKVLPFHTDLPKHRQMNVCQRSRFRQVDVLPARQFAGASTNEDGGQWVTIVLVAVGHVRTVQKDRVVQQCSLTVANRGQLAEEFRKPVHVPGLNLNEFLDSPKIVGMMRYGMEGV